MKAVELPTDDKLQAGPDFEGFFRAEFERLFQTMYLSCGNRAEAEDMAQEAMVRVYERWGRVRGADSPVAYLYRVAFNLHRRRARRGALALRRAVGLSPAPDPAVVAEDRAEILAALRSLPRGLREALVLVEWLGMDTTEAAAIIADSH